MLHPPTHKMAQLVLYSTPSLRSFLPHTFIIPCRSLVPRFRFSILHYFVIIPLIQSCNTPSEISEPTLLNWLFWLSHIRDGSPRYFLVPRHPSRFTYRSFRNTKWNYKGVQYCEVFFQLDDEKNLCKAPLRKYFLKKYCWKKTSKRDAFVVPFGISPHHRQSSPRQPLRTLVAGSLPPMAVPPPSSQTSGIACGSSEPSEANCATATP